MIPVVLRWDLWFAGIVLIVVSIVGATWKVSAVLTRIEIRMSLIEERMIAIAERLRKLEEHGAPPARFDPAR